MAFSRSHIRAEAHAACVRADFAAAKPIGRLRTAVITSCSSVSFALSTRTSHPASHESSPAVAGGYKADREGDLRVAVGNRPLHSVVSRDRPMRVTWITFCRWLPLACLQSHQCKQAWQQGLRIAASMFCGLRSLGHRIAYHRVDGHGSVPPISMHRSPQNSASPSTRRQMPK